MLRHAGMHVPGKGYSEHAEDQRRRIEKVQDDWHASDSDGVKSYEAG